jgi:hypothetical protein
MKDLSNCDVSNCDVSKNEISKKRCIRKRLREILVNFIIDIFRLTGLSDVKIGYIIKVLHFLAPWNMLLNAITLPLKIAPIVLLPFFIASGLFILLKGCFLTSVEYKLCKDDFNIVDPYIYLFKQKPTKHLRYTFTLGGMIVHFFILLLILFIRIYSSS